MPKKYKNILHKFLCFGKHKYILYDKYIPIEFIQNNKLDAQIAFLRITHFEKNRNNKVLNSIHSVFADKYPDLYIGKIMPYKGFKTSRQPLMSVDYI